MVIEYDAKGAHTLFRFLNGELPNGVTHTGGTFVSAKETKGPYECSGPFKTLGDPAPMYAEDARGCQKATSLVRDFLGEVVITQLFTRAVPENPSFAPLKKLPAIFQSHVYSVRREPLSSAEFSNAKIDPLKNSRAAIFDQGTLMQAYKSGLNVRDVNVCSYDPRTGKAVYTLPSRGLNTCGIVKEFFNKANQNTEGS